MNTRRDHTIGSPARLFSAALLAGALGLGAVGCDEGDARARAPESETIRTAAQGETAPVAAAASEQAPTEPKPAPASAGASTAELPITGGRERAELRSTAAAAVDAEADAPADETDADADASADADAPMGPRIVAGEELDFGVVFSREELKGEIEFRNDGDSTLTIRRIASSCGCTVPRELPKKNYEPGETGSLEVAFRPRAGKTTKYVTLMTNDPVRPALRIPVSAEVIEPAKLLPVAVQLGQVASGSSHSAEFRVVGRDPELEILSITPPDELADHMTFEVSEVQIETDPEMAGQKLVTVMIDETTPSGNINAPVEVIVRAAPQPGMETREITLRAFVRGFIRGDLQNSPRFLRIMGKAQGEDFEERTMIFARSGRPFEVTDVRVENANLEDISAEAIKLTPEDGDREGYWIVIKGNTGDARGAFQGKVIVETTLDNEGPLSIIFNGLIARPSPRLQR